MEGFEVLGVFKKQLCGLVRTLDNSSNDTNNTRMTVLQECVIKDVMQYNDSKKRMIALLQQKEGSEIYFSNLFMPSCPFHLLTNAD